MVYRFCRCMSLHISPGEIFILIAILGKKLSFWLSACSVLIVQPLLQVRPSYPFVSWNGRC